MTPTTAVERQLKETAEALEKFCSEKVKADEKETKMTRTEEWKQYVTKALKEGAAEGHRFIIAA